MKAHGFNPKTIDDYLEIARFNPEEEYKCDSLDVSETISELA